MQKITHCLFVKDNAEEMMRFYVATLPGAKAGKVVPYGDAGPGPKGATMLTTFSVAGQEFMLLNGRPDDIQPSLAASFVLHCENQQEIDELWERLTAGGGEPGVCGWLKDRFGVSWQVVPSNVEQMAGSSKVMAEVMKMKKLDIATLQKAARE